MGSERVTLKVDSASAISATVLGGSETPAIRIERSSREQVDDATVLAIEHENSAIVVRVRWKDEATDDCEPKTVPVIGQDGVDDSPKQGAPTESRSYIGGRLSELLAAERRLQQQIILSGRVEVCSQRLNSLSEKELEVLMLIIKGSSCKDIATKLRIGQATVAKHKVKILNKLSVRDTVELIQILNAMHYRPER